MNRTREQWVAVCPKTVAKTASPAAVMYLIGDALSDIARLHRQVDQLQAEVEALRKDAGRYRWLSEFTDRSPQAIEHLPCSDGDLLDDVIDAALAAKEGRP